ncbi:hypothetical protein TRVA0_001S08350 [Trichomonascus vanleenenianus]|uniref:uncharacterized protein n=1 Tax=Trichomonascus vanleenenianus TaxID=2268995 RepID=UPI003EC9F31B
MVAIYQAIIFSPMIIIMVAACFTLWMSILLGTVAYQYKYRKKKPLDDELPSLTEIRSKQDQWRLFTDTDPRKYIDPHDLQELEDRVDEIRLRRQMEAEAAVDREITSAVEAVADSRAEREGLIDLEAIPNPPPPEETESDGNEEPLSSSLQSSQDDLGKHRIEESFI